MARIAAAIAALSVLTVPALAWNAVGHRAVAALAYDNLSAKARARVDDLIRRHPDYNKWTEGAPADAKRKARFAFTKAAVWPDTIKGDSRFYDEARRDAKATPTLAGFPDMKQHRNWHYFDIPFSTDGTPFPTPNEEEPSALSVLNRIIPLMGKGPVGKASMEDPVYLLPWLLHLVGDEHQPLHCTTRYRKGQVDSRGRAMGDLGGNTVNVVGTYNLHAFWDDALGQVDSDKYMEGLVKYLAKQPKEKTPELTPKKWIEEGSKLAQEVVYSFGNEGGFKDSPLRLDSAYVAKARATARARAAIGARRLAAVLNRELK